MHQLDLQEIEVGMVMQDKIKKIIIITIVVLSILVIAIYVKTNNSNNLYKKNENNTINKEEKSGNLIKTNTSVKEIYNKENLIKEFKNFFGEDKEDNIKVEENVKEVYAENIKEFSIKNINKLINVKKGEETKSIQTDIAKDSNKEVSIKEVREKLEEFCKKLGFDEIIYYSDNYEKTKDKAEDIRINVIAKKVVDGKEYTLRLRAIYLKNKNNHLTDKIQHVKVSIYNSVNERFEV